MMDEYELLLANLQFLEESHKNLTGVIDTMEMTDYPACTTAAMALKYERRRIEEEIKRLQDRLQALEQ